MIFNHTRLLSLLLLLIAGILAAFLVLGFFSIRVKNTQTSELLNLADHATEIEVLGQQIRTLQNEASADIAAFNNIVITGDSFVPLIESLEEAGKELGLEIKILSVEKVDEKKSAKSHLIKIVIETSGPWPQTLSFLELVESLPNRVTIDESRIFKESNIWRSKTVLGLYSFN